MIDEERLFGRYIKNAIAKGEKIVSTLTRSGALHNIVLYGAPVWQPVTQKLKYRKVLGALVILQVITGITPNIYFFIIKYVHRHIVLSSD